jgi:hypothetical protein
MKRKIITGTVLLLMGIIFNACPTKDYDTFSTLYGVVSDSETKSPISGVDVMLSPGGKTKTTGSDGMFEFTDLDAQQYTITVQKTGYQTNRKTISAVSGEKTEANISMTKN